MARKSLGAAAGGATDLITRGEAQALIAGAAGAMPVSGRWSCAQGPWTGEAQAAQADGLLRFGGFSLARQTTFRSIAATITNAGSAGSVFRLCVYSDTDGRPGSLVYATPAIDSAGAGDKVIDGINLTLPAGRYWLGYVSQGAPATNPQIRIFAGYLVAGTAMGGNAGNAYVPHVNPGHQVPGITGAPPSTISAASFTYVNGTFDVPQVWLRAA